MKMLHLPAEKLEVSSVLLDVKCCHGGTRSRACVTGGVYLLLTLVWLVQCPYSLSALLEVKAGGEKH